MSSFGEILYVLSDVRSGSTLLDQLLGAHHDVVSVGELHWLPAYVRQDRSIYNPVHPLVCTCGEPVSQCAFWRDVQEASGRSLDSFQLRPRFSNWRGRGSDSRKVGVRIKNLPMRFIRRFPDAYRSDFVQHLFGAPRLVQDSIELSNAILRVSGKKLLVDSSKSAFKFRSVYKAQPDRVKAIVLTRDYRAVVHSKMKRGESLDGAALGWRRKMDQILAMTNGISGDHYCTLKYEDLCENPEREIRNLCTFLGLDFDVNMLARPTQDVHHIGGSPSKFDPAKRAISLDTRYLDAFKPCALAQMRQIVGSAGDYWGY